VARPAATLDDLLDISVERDPDAVAVVDGASEYTYADLARHSGSLSTALIDAGVQRGDRVGIFMEKSWEAVVAMLAISRAGAAFVNVNPALKPAQVSYITGDCAIRVLIADSAKLESLPPGTVGKAFFKGHRPQSPTDATDLGEVLAGAGGGDGRRSIETDLGTILYTSGSTGLPKGVAFSHRNIVVGAEIVSHYLGISSADRILSVLPFSFDYGLNQLTTSMLVGARLIVQHSRLPGDLLRGLRRYGATGLAGVPPVWSLLLRNAASLEEEPLEELRYITNSGGRIPEANLAALRRLLPGTRIYLMYGLTEAFRSTYLPPEEIDRGSECIGKPVPDTEILVIRDGRECAPGEVGELVHRGPTVALGYWGKEEATRQAYRPNPLAPPELFDVERVVYSGDLVRRDEEGYLYFVGRDDAMIKSQGYRMSPEEIEDLLHHSGLIREACAFGVPDPEMGHRVVAVVSLRDGDAADAVDSLRQYAMQNGPSYMVPARILVLDELPKTGSGKVDRSGISGAYADG
jgi:acyl-CoA ligase (AMP-forming) (exosortase A-associated)